MDSKTTSEPSRGKDIQEKCRCRQTTHLDMALLYTCRQINEEASVFVYESNTSAFNSAKSLGAFLECISPSEREAVRKIQLSVIDPLHSLWQRAVTRLIVRNFTSLTHIYLWVDVGFAPCWFENDKSVQEPAWMRPILSLAKLPLKSATVVMADGSYPTSESGCIATYHTSHRHNRGLRHPYRVRRRLKHDSAEYLRTRLLGLPLSDI